MFEIEVLSKAIDLSWMLCFMFLVIGVFSGSVMGFMTHDALIDFWEWRKEKMANKVSA